jgi:hypothetical protein
MPTLIPDKAESQNDSERLLAVAHQVRHPQARRLRNVCDLRLASGGRRGSCVGLSSWSSRTPRTCFRRCLS